MKAHCIVIIAALACGVALAQTPEPLLIAPLYVEYTTSTPEEFANEVRELRRRVGDGDGGIEVGFSAFLYMQFSAADLNTPIDHSALRPTLADLELIVNRARANQIPVHISIASGFFHGYNALRDAAIQADVRNAQWFSDGWIADPDDIATAAETPRAAWITPSRYAQPMRQRIQESIQILGKEIATVMRQYPETFLSISGDTEVELSFARNLDSEGRARARGQVLLADYSPFTVAEFRDWLRSRYPGDASPATDDDRDGRTFNQDYRQQFTTWRLRYFDASGPIPYDQYRNTIEKLPKSGPNYIDGGFDPPRAAEETNPFWKSWQDFRVRVVANYVRDFAEWITNGAQISADRFYTHQIPADYLFGGKDIARLNTSASPLETAWIPGVGSAGVTVFNTYDGKTHAKTANAAMFKRLEQSGTHWGILEYNPSVPAVADENYYLSELRALYAFKPSIVVPFAWTNTELHKIHSIQNTAYEQALRKFVQEAGRDIHRR